MKHKKYNKIYPYTYFIKHIDSGIKYYGVRFANVRLGMSPEEDFCKKYFTSIKSLEFKWFKDLLINDLSKFEFRIHHTFDSKEEAISFEQKIIKRILGKNDWANQGYGKCISVKRKFYSNICCIYCKSVLDPGNYNRSHGDKCSKSPNYLLYYKPRTDSFKKHLSKIHKGRVFSEETKKKMSAGQKSRRKVLCGNCNKMFDPGNYGKYHGDKCKLKTV